MDTSLIENMIPKVLKMQICWPAAGDSSIKIPGPIICRTEGNYWIKENEPDRRYRNITELVWDLADFEEAKRLKLMNDEFAASGI